MSTDWLPNPQGNLGRGHHEVGGGLEKFTFEIDTAQVLSASAQHSPTIFKMALLKWYASLSGMFWPVPAFADIFDYKVRPLTEWELDQRGMKGRDRMEVTIILKRGQFFLAELMSEHDDLFIKKDGSVRCSCHPGRIYWILREHVPNYKRFKDDEGSSEDSNSERLEDQDAALSSAVD